MNPRDLGIDENFLSQELQQGEVEDLIERIEMYEEILER